MKLIKSFILSFLAVLLIASALKSVRAQTYAIEVTYSPTQAKVEVKIGDTWWPTNPQAPGFVTIPVSGPGTYPVKVSADGYQEEEQEAIITNENPIVSLRFDLKSLGPPEIESIEAPDRAPPGAAVPIKAKVNGNLSLIKQVRFYVSVNVKEELTNPNDIFSNLSLKCADDEQKELYSCTWQTQTNTKEGTHLIHVVLERTGGRMDTENREIVIDPNAPPPDTNNSNGNGSTNGGGGGGGGGGSSQIVGPATPLLTPVTRAQNPLELVQTIIYVIIGLSAGLLLIVMAMGGVRYLTAAGNEEQAHKAKQTLLYGAIGFIIVLAAYAIMQYIHKFFTGAGF